MKNSNLNIIDFIKIWVKNIKTVIFFTIIFSIIFTSLINRSLLNYKNIYAEFFLKENLLQKLKQLQQFGNNEKIKFLESLDDKKIYNDTVVTTSELALGQFYDALDRKFSSNNIIKSSFPKFIKSEYTNTNNINFLKVYISLEKSFYNTENLEKLKKQIIEVNKFLQQNYTEKIYDLKNEYLKYSKANIQKEIQKLEYLVNEKKNWRNDNEDYFIETKNNILIYNFNNKQSDNTSLFLSVTALENKIKNLEKQLNTLDTFVLSEFEDAIKYIKDYNLIYYDNNNLFKEAPPSYKEGQLFYIFAIILSFLFSLIITLLINFYKKSKIK